MKSTRFLLKNKFLLKNLKIGGNLLMNFSKRGFKQCNDLRVAVETASLEEINRSAKFLEYTDKVYKPSKTITFDRNGEVLLYHNMNIRNSTIYFKYPEGLFTATIPLAFYNFFMDPGKLIFIFFSRNDLVDETFSNVYMRFHGMVSSLFIS